MVVSRRLDNELKCKLQDALITMHLDDCGFRQLREGLIERFVAVKDEDYGDIRKMLEKVQGVEFLFE